MTDIALESAVRARSTLESVAIQMLAAFAMVDGVVDPTEVDVVRRICDDWGLGFNHFLRAVEDGAPEDAGARFLEYAATVDEGDREVLAALLSELAAAGSRLDDREAELLQALHCAWGVAISFANKAFEWDPEQTSVINAAPDARLIVSAGPGMGKTAVACARVSRLVEHEHLTDSNIWLVSFTRSAVGELKARISDFAEAPGNVFDVKISTIDSQAWRVRYGFTEEQAAKLFGGFDTGIEAAISLMRERSEDFREVFGALEHLIIDEAQDITGARARFLLEIIDLLNDDCGITVFHDPAQAIYDYAVDGGAPFRLVDALKEKLGGSLRELALRKIHRTEDPGLLQLYEDLRLDVLGNAEVGAAAFEGRAQKVKDAAGGSSKFDYRGLGEYANALVLFRRRVEVVQTSAFMAGDGLPHRMRMSGLPVPIQPWLGILFHAYEKREIEESAFRELASEAFDRFDAILLGTTDLYEFSERNWALLRRFGSMGPRTTAVDLWKIRGRLQSPPDEFVVAELGERGPILGTIHASKGREAEHVVLQINKSWASRDEGGDESDFAEESRVLFVGATRAKERLSVQDGLSLPYSSSINDRRVYRPSARWAKAKAAQVQIGIAGDQDFASIAEQPLDLAALLSERPPWECTAVLTPDPWHYRISDARARFLGRFTPAVNRDLFKLAEIRLGKGALPPKELRRLAVLAYTTVAAAPAAPGTASRIAAPFDKSGFWVAPVIAGFPMAFCQWARR